MLEPQGRGSALWPWAILVSSLGFAALGAFFAVKWVTTDEPDAYGSCSRGSGSCLQGGETLNMVMTLVWGSLGLAGTVVGLVMVVRRLRRSAADRALIEHGRQGEAVITGVRQRGMVTRTNGHITSLGYELFLDPEDGGAPLAMKVTLPPGVMAGGRARVAYDATTRDAVLLEIPRAPVAVAIVART